MKTSKESITQYLRCEKQTTSTSVQHHELDELVKNLKIINKYMYHIKIIITFTD